MQELINFSTQYGAHGLLLLAVYSLGRVVLYLNRKREEERAAADERYLSMIREMGAVLVKIKDHLEDSHDE
jgi:steroid 5-alpha reductase family enzyme